MEIYDAPLALGVEVWSPSTGDYDIDARLSEYQERGDREIWRLRPFEQTLTTWRRRDDGGYDEHKYRRGTVMVGSQPGITVDLHLLVA